MMKKTIYYMFTLWMMAVSISSCCQKKTSQIEDPIVDVMIVKEAGEMAATTFTGKTKSASEVNLAFRVA